MLVPVGIAYAEASGVPGIYGLYATIVPLLAYALFGPSRILVLGPDSSLAPIILASSLPLAGGDPARAVALAGAMAIVAGRRLHRSPGLARLGFVTELLSKPIRYGYMNGIALDGAYQPDAEAASASRSRATGRCAACWAIGRRRLPDGKANLDGAARRRRHAGR